MTSERTTTVPCRPVSVWSQSLLDHVAFVFVDVTRTVRVSGHVQVPWSNWPTPAGGEQITSGTEVYPLPAAVLVNAVTTPPEIVAVAVAPAPPPPAMLTVGATL